MKINEETYQQVVDQLSYGLDHAKTILVNLAKFDPELFLDIMINDGRPVHYTVADKEADLIHYVLKLAEANSRNSNWNRMGKVELIKAHRALTGSGLKESKDWVESVEELRHYF